MQKIKILLVLLLVAVLGMGHLLRERFSVVESNATISLANVGPEPWNHHEISSIPSDTVTQYPQTYYNEFSNEQFEHALKTSLGFPCKKTQDVLQQTWNKNTDWRAVPSYVRSAYDQTMQFLRTTLQSSKDMQLPYDNPKNRPTIQIVHDRWTAYYTQSLNTHTVLLDFEFITYRESKFQGKHVVARALCEWNVPKKKYDIYMIEIHVEGVVSEDQIGMHPVLPKNPYDLTVLTADEPYPLSILDATTMQTILRNQQEQQTKDQQASQAVAAS